MKKTQRRDAVRNIRKKLVSYLSIIIIAMLATGSFLGLNYTGDALKGSAADFYTKTSFRDIEIISTQLITPEDMDILREQEGVADAEGVLMTSGRLKGAGEERDVDVFSLTERINTPEVLEGTLPEKKGECAVETQLMDLMGLKIGDTVTISDKDGNAPSYLKETTFTVTARVCYPTLYTDRGYDTSNRCILVKKTAFDQKKLDGHFMRAEITIDGHDDASLPESAYLGRIAAVYTPLEELAKVRADARTDQMHKEYQDRIDKAERKLKEADEELKEARSELDEAKKTIEENEKALAEADQKLKEADAELVKGYNEAETQKAILRSDLQSNLVPLLDEKKQKEIIWAEEAPIETADTDGLDALRFVVTDKVTITLQPSLEDTLTILVSEMNRQHDLGLTKEDEELLILMIVSDEGYAETEASYDTSYAAMVAWNESYAEYRSEKAEYYQKTEELNAAKADYEAGEESYAAGLEDYEKSEKKLAKLEKAFEELPDCHWVVMDPEKNIGFMTMQFGVDNMVNTGRTFAVLFLILGALVIYATCGRIIEEERHLIGTGKALGLFSREVFLKYLIFGVSAAALGTVFGALAGYFLIERVMINANEAFYVVSEIAPAFDLPLTLITLAAAAAVAALAVFTAGRRLIPLPATELMKPKLPRLPKRAPREGKQVRSLYSALIRRNMRQDLGRVTVTVISVAGCCILLVIGFTLQFNVSATVDRQYDDIYRYEAEIRFDPTVNKDAADAFEKILSEEGVIYAPISRESRMTRFDDRMAAVSLVAGDPEKLAEQMNLRDRVTGTPIGIPEEGILLQSRLAEYYQRSAGDFFILYDADFDLYDAEVAGVYESYFDRTLILSNAAYRDLYGEKPKVNGYFIKDVKDPEELREKLEKVEGFVSYTEKAESREQYENMTGVLISISLLLTVAAALMAWFVLLNLINMYLIRKKTELIVMRVNGFTTKETKRYISMESVITTVIGILLGLVAGTGIAWYIQRLLEKPQMGFIHSLCPEAWIPAAVITAIFALVINVVAMRKIKDLRLTDIA